MNDWHPRASCRNHPHPEWWFPETPQDSIRDTPKAVAVCQTCPARTECLQHVHRLENIYGRQAGVWAATTPKQRVQRPLPPHPVVCLECQTVFYSRSHRAKYCTQTCRQRAYDRLNHRTPKDTE